MEISCYFDHLFVHFSTWWNGDQLRPKFRTKAASPHFIEDHNFQIFDINLWLWLYGIWELYIKFLLFCRSGLKIMSSIHLSLENVFWYLKYFRMPWFLFLFYCLLSPEVENYKILVCFCINQIVCKCWQIVWCFYYFLTLNDVWSIKILIMNIWYVLQFFSLDHLNLNWQLAKVGNKLAL